jgi:nucleoid-associated protein YgaU
MANRFIRRNIIVNSKEMYKEYLKDRGIKSINQYDTPTFNYPSTSDLKNIRFASYVWKNGDKLAKLSDQFYGSPKDWWIIARFNNIGCETSIQIGDIIRIPLDLNDLNYLVRG